MNKVDCKIKSCHCQSDDTFDAKKMNMIIKQSSGLAIGLECSVCKEKRYFNE